MKRKATFVSVLLAAVLLFLLPTGISAENNAGRSAADSTALYGEAKSVILIEAATGRVLYEHEADIRLPPASVTKVMTLLLIAEEIDRGTMKLTDTVQVSDNASHMGGSQVYLKAGEEMSVEDLLKSVIIASANDAATALAEQAALGDEVFLDRGQLCERDLNAEIAALPAAKWNGVKVVTSGIICDNPTLLKIFKDNNVAIAADDVAHESRAFRTDASEEGDPMMALVDQFTNIDYDVLLYDPQSNQNRRGEFVANLVKESGAQGLVLFMQQFCDPEEMEFPYLKKALDAAGIPFIKLGVDQQMRDFGQAATAIQAFADVLSVQ